MHTDKIGSKIMVFEVFAMFMLTGAACVSIGTSLLHLSQFFEVTISHAAILASAMALGRVSTVFISSIITEKFGCKFSLLLGIIMVVLFCLSIPLTHNFVIAAVGAAFGGIGQGLQDSSSPVILQYEFKENYHRAVSMTQVFFGIGSFLTPLVFSLLLFLGMDWRILYYGLFALAGIMLFFMPYAKIPKGAELHQHMESRNLIKEKETIKPLKILLFILLVFTYTAVINTIYTYTAAYNISIGLSESVSVSMLTIFSIGSMIGALVFTVVLKYFKVISVLIFNCIMSFIIFSIIKSTNVIGILLPGYFVFGGLFGVVYSLLVSASTEMMPKRASFAAALVAFFSGSADILSPLITGKLVNISGIQMSFKYASIMGYAMVFFAAAYYLVYIRAKMKNKAYHINT